MRNNGKGNNLEKINMGTNKFLELLAFFKLHCSEDKYFLPLNEGKKYQSASRGGACMKNLQNVWHNVVMQALPLV